MKEQTDNKASSKFLKTDRGKTKSNTIEVPSISLPKGGGAIKGIDEKFSVNAVNGTASFSIQLPFSPSRGVSPSLSLSYNSGAGTGIFGLGWNLGLSSIKRKTDKGLPQYLDAIDSDTFLFSEAEDLVPEFKKLEDGSFESDAKGDFVVNEKDSFDGKHIVRYYKPRIEGLFARIERWTAKDKSEKKWRITTRDNSTTLFGWTNNSRIADPSDESRIFEWLPEFVFDDKGNCAQNIYKKENQSGFQHSMLHNRNRLKDGQLTYTNTYLEKVVYGNKTPYLNFGDDFPIDSDYLFSTVFDYGTLDETDAVDTLNDWDFRSDAFSDYKAGFEIRTTRLCKRVLLFHHFIGENEYEGLVRSVNFEYDTNVEEDFTFLKKIHSHGYIKKQDGTYSEKKLPPMEFEYQAHEWNKEVKSIANENIIHAPSGLDEQQYQFTDLFNEGLSGILTEQANGWYYKHNLGNGSFEQAKLVTPKPSFSGLGSVMQLADLDADGGKQLISYNSAHSGYFELDDENEWQPFRTFKSLPNINFKDPNVRMLDLNGDGMPEVVLTEDHVFTWYPSEGRNGFSQARKTTKPFDEEEGPHIVFADSTQSIFLADMSGDGLTDMVRIRNGEVCYWPNLGYGKFGYKVGMDNAPLFDYPDAFNPSYLRLADIDGSGTTDIIYLGKNKFSCWKNLSGNRFGTSPFEIESFPEIHSQAKITVTDLLGNGVACIVWSSPLSKDANTPLKYIDLMNSKKPHIMVSYRNNLGKEVTLEYAPSTRFYLEDKSAGKPWVTKLHFPVHCISKSTTEDKISGYRFVSKYKYHHGYYDHPEREFRGFGMVEQIDSETFEHWVKGDASNITEESLHQEPVVSRTWFHTGAFLGKERILNQFKEDYWFAEMERQGYSVTHPETELPDAVLIRAPGLQSSILENISAIEWQEALRACKGMALRNEIFAKDAVKHGNTNEAIQKELTPYTVSTHNCIIEIVQPKGKNKHAVFVVKESEAITYNYERNPDDPRIAHNLNIKLDEYGNVLESAAVVYPRKITDPSLPTETLEEQAKTIIIYTQNQFTNDVIKDESYRLRLPSEVKTFELKGLVKTGIYYNPSEFGEILSNINSDTAFYHEFDRESSGGKSLKRLIEHVRTIYYNNDLSGALPLHQLESLALPFESYQLAYTPELVADIFASKVAPALLEEGKFTHSEGDDNWWIRSGRVQFDADHFFVPLSYTDPFGAITKVSYYGNYYLFIKETEDALGNKSGVDVFNFRTLSPTRMKDINGNFSEVLSDELGLVKAMAILGKGEEADDLSGLNEFTDETETEQINDFFNPPDTLEGVSDSNLWSDTGKKLLQHATARFVYDFDAYMLSGKPAVAASILREKHYQLKNDSKIQIAFEYSNGIGEVVMKKVQAEPGLAKKVILYSDETISIVEIDTGASDPKLLRWIGNGKVIKNNKGNPVKQYEPYFSVNPRYEDYKELVETGVTPLLYYDAAGRLIKTEMPDDTFLKVEFDSWKQSVYDANDTVLDTEWYNNRFYNLMDAELIEEGKDPVREKQAAEKAAKHANTPNVLYFDTLGRPVLSIDHNLNIDSGVDEYNHTKVKLDVESNLRSVTDARGNEVMEYKYDMLGIKVYQKSMDAGQRWLLLNIAGKPLRTWDERNHEFQYFYDIAQRPIYSKVIGGDGDTALNHIFDRVFYGESLLTDIRTNTDRLNETDLQSRNILGQVIKYYDTGGLTETYEYDFKGQPLSTTRKLFKDYKEIVNWTDDRLAGYLETTEFTFKTETDALGRITNQVAPDGSIITPLYNEAGLLNGEDVLHLGADAPVTYIKDIDYNEKAQRNKIIYGNDISTKFTYDEKTFRLVQLKTVRKNSDTLQDLHYTYDPVGNITHIQDNAIATAFYNNMRIEPASEYTYDALYQLVKATGRENDATLSFNGSDNWNDGAFMHQMNPGDPMAMRNYVQSYSYDEVGNIIQMKHMAGDNSWTRNYDYETNNNRLKSTGMGGEMDSYPYTHHPQHGFITKMPHLLEMGWNFKEELVKTIRQKVTNGGTPETTYYQYDGQGQRIRKITENQAGAGSEPSKKDERIYISGFETYRRYQVNTITFERESLSLMDEGHRFVMVETVKTNTDSSPDSSERIGLRLVRFQLHNHLGSSALELDDTGEVISFEEYHPFGTTAYQAMNKNIKAAAKRYRYTGMERDEETGLEYHSARYYLHWLGRWLSCDPIGIGDGVNVFKYVHNNPNQNNDKNGLWADDYLSLRYETRVSTPLVMPYEMADSLDAFLANSEKILQINNPNGELWIGSWNAKISIAGMLAYGTTDLLRFGSTAGQCYPNCSASDLSLEAGRAGGIVLTVVGPVSSAVVKNSSPMKTVLNPSEVRQFDGVLSVADDSEIMYAHPSEGAKIGGEVLPSRSSVELHGQTLTSREAVMQRGGHRTVAENFGLERADLNVRGGTVQVNNGEVVNVGYVSGQLNTVNGAPKPGVIGRTISDESRQLAILERAKVGLRTLQTPGQFTYHLQSSALTSNGVRYGFIPCDTTIACNDPTPLEEQLRMSLPSEH